MHRKIIISIILVCLVGIAVFLTIFLKSTETVENKAYDMIPNDVALVFDLKNISKASDYLTSENKLVEGVSKLPFAGEIYMVLEKFVSAINGENFKVFAENQFISAVKQLGKNKLDFLYVIPLSATQKSLAKKFVETAFNVTDADEKDEDDVIIYSYTTDSFQRGTMSFCIYENTLLLSESRLSLESALKAYKEKSNLNQCADFQKINKSSGVMTVYMNYDRMSVVFQQVASESFVASKREYPHYAGWTQFDLDYSVKNNLVWFTGYTVKDSTNALSEYIGLFDGQKKVSGKLTSILPSTTAHFVAMGVSDKAKFKIQYEGYLSKNNYLASYQKNIQNLNNEFSLDSKTTISDLFYSWLDDEFGLAVLPSSSDNVYENSYAVFEVENPEQVEMDFYGILESYAKKHDESVKTTDFGDYTIYAVPVSRLPQQLFGNLFSNVSAKCVTFLDSYMIFSNSEQSLEMFLNDNNRGATLAADMNYGRFEENLKSSYSLYTYVSIPRSIGYLRTFFDEKIAKEYDTYTDDLKSLNAVSYQLIADNDNKLYSSICLSLQSIKNDKPEGTWRIRLDTTMIGKPTMFVTHRNENVTLLQDANFSLYMIENQSGNILWKKQVDGPIMGDIQIIDVYNNKKTQYLFNTKRTVYLFDRNGDFVTGFPFGLTSPASAPLAVFDYDKNCSYRIVIPCEDTTINLFSITAGLPIKMEWEAKTENPITMPLRHFSEDGKDYIVYADKYHIHIVNRKGQNRIVVDELIEKAPYAQIEFVSGADETLSRFVTTDVDGNLREIFLDGTVQTSSNCGTHSDAHYFLMADLNDDGNGEYIFVDGTKIEGYGQDYKRIFHYSASSNLKNPFVVGRGDDMKIGVSAEDGNIYLFDSKGTLEKGFPIQAQTDFDVCIVDKNVKGFDIIVGADQNILYYYTVKK